MTELRLGFANPPAAGRRTSYPLLKTRDFTLAAVEDRLEALSMVLPLATVVLRCARSTMER